MASTEALVRSGGGSSCGGFLSLILLIAGGIIYGVCKDASVNGSCGGNQEISDVGFIMMIVGGSIVAFIIFICFFLMVFMCCCSYFCDNV
jgi:hypothetical protein